MGRQPTHSLKCIQLIMHALFAYVEPDSTLPTIPPPTSTKFPFSWITHMDKICDRAKGKWPDGSELGIGMLRYLIFVEML